MESQRQEYAGGNIWKDKKRSRLFTVVFAPWAPPTDPPVPYDIGMQGVFSVTKSEKEEEEGSVGSEHADLLREELWATDDDEEFP
jgi:hypothetical protein